MRRNRNIAPWLSGVIIATLQFIFLFSCAYLHYSLSDDLEIARSLLGYWGGAAATFSPYVHPLLVYPLHWLTALFPGIFWFAWLQIGLLWCTAVLWCNAILQLFLRLQRPVWLGVCLYLLFSFVLILPYAAGITYTVTATLIASASIFQLFTIDLRETKGLMRRLLLSLLPILAGYLLRQPSAYPAIAFWVILLAVRYLLLDAPARARVTRAIGKACLLGVLVFSVIIGIRAIDTSAQGQSEYLRWQKARAQLTDYDAVDALTLEDLTAVGWTEGERAMFQNWYFLEENITAGAMETLHTRYAAASVDSLDPPHTVWRAFLNASSKYSSFSVWWKLLALLATFTLLSLFTSGNRQWWQYLAPISCCLLAGFLFAFLALQGRIPERALASILFPALAALLCLAVTAAPVRFTKGVLLPAAIAILTLVVAVSAAAASFTRYYAPAPDRYQSASTNPVTAYVNRQPDLLFLQDGTVTASSALWSASSTATNLLPLTDWNSRSPEKRIVYTAFGFDPDHLSITILLADNVRLLTQLAAPDETLLAYLTEKAGTTVYAVQTGFKGNLRVFRFTLQADTDAQNASMAGANVDYRAISLRITQSSLLKSTSYCYLERKYETCAAIGISPHGC